MRFDPAHVVGVGGALGALLRYYVGTWIDGEEFPFGTVTVNVLGSFLLGFVTFAGADHEFVLLLGAGVSGSFTTFSSFSFQTVRLWETGERARAAANALGTLAGAGVALSAAWMLARALAG